MATALRPAIASDEEFLFSVYASTRVDEMSLVSWDDSQKESFLRMQFYLQDRFYKENYPGAQFQVIMLDEQSIGRLYIHRRSTVIHIIDIALLPEFQKRGIGSTLLNAILEEARTDNLPVTIHVERFNPALHLYQRLGFSLVEDRGVYYFLRWSSTKEQHEHAG